ncbi:MAG: hypothetical protein ACXVQ0_10360 [Actinomycetota bacterium]
MEVEYAQEEQLVFISEGGDAAFSVDQLAGPPAASVAAIDDPFYVATSDDPDSFEHEKERSGVVHMAGIVGHGATTWTIVFQFDDGSVISASAALPQLGDGRPGEGAGTVHGGAGRFRGARGDFQVRVKNPHRWSLTI